MAAVEVTLRVELTSNEVAGWHPRERKDCQAAIDDVAFRVCDQQFSQGTAWCAMLTRSEDVEAQGWLLRLVERLRCFSTGGLTPRDISMAVIHERRWPIDPFVAVLPEEVYASPTFARDGRLFGAEPDEIYLDIALRSQALSARPDREDLLRAVAAATPEDLDFHAGVGDCGPSLVGSEDHAGLGDQLVAIAAVLRNAGFPLDTRLQVVMERSWWVDVFPSAGPAEPTAPLDRGGR
jgi:hypothetical protein